MQLIAEIEAICARPFGQRLHFSASFSSPAAVAGYPHITVPAGYVHGLPVGLSFGGAAPARAAVPAERVAGGAVGRAAGLFKKAERRFDIPFMQMPHDVLDGGVLQQQARR